MCRFRNEPNGVVMDLRVSPITDPEIARLAEAGAAMAVVSVDGARVLWASPAGAAFLGLSSIGREGAALDPDRWPIDHFAAVAADQTMGTGSRLERLPGFSGPAFRPATVALRRVLLPGGVIGMLLVAVGAKGIPCAPPIDSDFDAIDASTVSLANPVRFVWQTGPDDVWIIQPDQTGIEPVVTAIAGHLWPIADAVRHALAGRTTFIGIDACLPMPDGQDALDLVLSGTPITAIDGAFCGFCGFGFYRGRRASDNRLSQPATDPVPFPSEEAPISLPPAMGSTVFDISVSPSAPGLSESERQAFREIARVLAGHVPTQQPRERPMIRPLDEVTEALVSDVPSALSVLPIEAPSGPDPVHALLDRLPQGIMVCRGAVPIVMNRPLLEWLGHDDADAFYAAGGIEVMFGGRDPARREADDGTMLLQCADGRMIALSVTLQTMQWEGLPASLMLFERPSDEPPSALGREFDDSGDISARELAAVLDTATDGVIVLDEQGRILSLNRSAEALFGLDFADVAGDRLIALLTEDSRRRALDYFEGLRGDGVASVLNDGREVTGQVSDGGRIPLFMTIGRISPAPHAKFCVVLRDITAFKKAERDLIDARRHAEVASARKSDFLARISHEIRTPLSAIIGFAELMHEERFGPLGNDRYRDYLKDILTSGAHVVALANDILDISKIEAGRSDLEFREVDLNGVLKAASGILQEAAARGRVILRVSLAPDLPKVVADERSLIQITLNLLSNAIKFTLAGGQIIVSTTLAPSGEVILRIKDTGVGMSESELQTALEPFRQLATARRLGGTGLGLPLAKALVEANRASLSIQSRRNAGTLVEITFPAHRVLAG